MQSKDDEGCCCSAPMIRGAFEITISEDAVLTMLDTIYSQPPPDVEQRKPGLAELLKPLVAGMAPIVIGAMLGALRPRQKAGGAPTPQDEAAAMKWVADELGRMGVPAPDQHGSTAVRVPPSKPGTAVDEPAARPPAGGTGVGPHPHVAHRTGPPKPYPGEPSNA